MIHESRHPARFRAHGRVQVDAKDGTPFYVFDDPGEFTLPAGSYTVAGGSLIGRMKPRKGHDAPSSVRCPIPRRIRLVFAPNPRKAVISLPDGIIIADPSLKRLPSFCLVFILFHEIGHYFYQDEAGCDRFAADEMARRGYMPSQIMAASELTMNDHERRSCNIDNARRLDAQRHQ